MPMSAFTTLLKSLVDKKFKSRRQFLLEADPARSIGGASGALSQVFAEKIPPPLHTVPKWADALGLIGEERQRFEDLAAIAHLPPEVQPHFVGILDEHRLQGQQIAELYETVKILEKTVGDIKHSAGE